MRTLVQLSPAHSAVLPAVPTLNQRELSFATPHMPQPPTETYKEDSNPCLYVSLPSSVVQPVSLCDLQVSATGSLRSDHLQDLGIFIAILTSTTPL